MRSLHVFFAVLFSALCDGCKLAKIPAPTKLFSSYNLVLVIDTHIPRANFNFSGWSVFVSPRKLKRALGDTAGGVAVLLRGLVLRSLFKEYKTADGLPPECGAL